MRDPWADITKDGKEVLSSPLRALVIADLLQPDALPGKWGNMLCGPSFSICQPFEHCLWKVEGLPTNATGARGPSQLDLVRERPRTHAIVDPQA